MGSRLMTEIFNQSTEKSIRQELRNSMPTAEVILWTRLRGRQLLGCKFRRQYSVGAYVMDFYSPEVKLGIELDGDSHFRGSANVCGAMKIVTRSSVLSESKSC